MSGLTTSVSYQSGANWLTLSLNAQATPAQLTVQLNNGQLSAGSYQATVDVRSSSGSYAQIQVSCSVMGATGSLAINVNGLPTGAAGAVTVTGPNGYSSQESKSTVISNLSVGTYTVTAQSVTYGGQTYNPNASMIAATVTVGQTTTVMISYTAPPTPGPTATTQSAGNIGAAGFTMNGVVNPNGGSTQGWFEWGTSSSLSTYGLTTAANAGSGTSDVSFASTLSGLSCGMTYYYRMVAGPSEGSVVRGSIVSATTSTCPPITGNLTITVTGLPSGAWGQASVFTSGGSLVGSLGAGSNPTTFNNLAAGTYSVHAYAVTSGSSTYNPTDSTQSVSVTAGGTASVTVMYALQAPPRTIGLNVGAVDTASVANGANLNVPIIVDMSQAQGQNLASMTYVVTWDPTKFDFVTSANGTFGASPSFFPNVSQTASGILTVGVFDLNGFTSGTPTIMTVTLKAKATGGTDVSAAATAAGDENGTGIPLSLFVTRALTVTIR